MRRRIGPVPHHQRQNSEKDPLNRHKTDAVQKPACRHEQQVDSENRDKEDFSQSGHFTLPSKISISTIAITARQSAVISICGTFRKRKRAIADSTTPIATAVANTAPK